MTDTAAASLAKGKYNIHFKSQYNGYDKEQVDNYIKNLIHAYQLAEQEYNELCAKYDKIFKEFKKIEAQERCKLSARALAQQILAEAYAEADKIKGGETNEYW